MIEALTARGYDEPSVRQLVVFLHNRVGELGDILRRLDRDAIDVHALSVTDSVDFAVVRMVVANFDGARQVLNEMDLAVSVSEILAVELEEDRNSLLQACRSLIRGEINIHYVYAMLTRPRGVAAVLIHVDDVGTAIELLRKDGFALLDDQDLE